MTSYRVFFKGMEQPVIINSANFEHHWTSNGMYWQWWKNFKSLEWTAIEKIAISKAENVHAGRHHK